MEAKELLQQHIAKTVSLTDEQFDHFFSYFKPMSFKKGQTVIGEGDKVECEYFVISGCLKAFYVNDEIKMYLLQFAMPRQRGFPSAVASLVCNPCLLTNMNT